MKKLLALTLMSSAISTHALEPTANTFSSMFKNYDACFILYDVNNDKVLSEYNPHNRCNQRIAPDSTFKLPFGSPAASTRATIRSIKPGCESCLAETLTAINGLGSAPFSIKVLTAAQAVSNTYSPTGTMSEVSSASATNSTGEICPRSG